MSATRPAMMPFDDRHHEVETPEHVALDFTLAGPGSRFTAFLYDAVIIAGLLTAVFLFVLLLVVLGAPRPALGFLLGLLLLAVFVIFWGYFIYFEATREGQTPGKRKVGLRVVHDGGHPLTLRGAAVRNLLRFVDIQPLPSWLLGGAFILLHPRAQRIGDIAAGTLVVRERAVASLPEESGTLGPPRLSAEQYDVLREYAQRRETLERDARGRIAASLAPHYAPFLPPRGAGGHLFDPANPRHVDGVLMTVYADESGRRAAAGARAGSGSPAAAALLRRQRERWAEYGRLLERARETRLAALPEAEVSRFAALYREIAADLARARTYGASRELIYTLERAVAGGHNLLYTPPARPLRRVWDWLRAGFPILVRQRAAPIMIAAALLFAPAFTSFAAVALDPGRARSIVPAEMIARAETGVERQARGLGYVDVPETLMPLFSSGIIANNVQVTFAAFAGGIFAGVGTVIILLMNGVLLGGVAGLFHVEALNLYFWSFVLPHGVIELTAICIAGGAGLWLGSALVLPGRRSRRAALMARAAEGASLIAGTAMLLLIAGIIEGFISPSGLEPTVKFAFAAGTALLLFPYLILAGRSGPDAAANGD